MGEYNARMIMLDPEEQAPPQAEKKEQANALTESQAESLEDGKELLLKFGPVVKEARDMIRSGERKEDAIEMAVKGMEKMTDDEKRLFAEMTQLDIEDATSERGDDLMRMYLEKSS